MSKIFGTLMKTVYSVGNIPIDIKQRRLDPIKAQNKELTKLLKRASSTAFGECYHFDRILQSDDIFNAFRENVPIFDYNSMYKNWWFRALNGETFVSWPGKVKYFALSSGTSEASSKFIPITNNMLSSIKKASLRQILAATKYDFPLDFYDKGFLMIGGSTHLQYNGTYYSGDLSGISAAKLPFWFEYFYKPGRKISKTTDWNTKLDEMVKKAPSWAFAPYEKSFEKLFGKPVVYSESYLASEGYIAYQVDLNKRIMQLIVDNGIYYEFVPFNETNFDEDGNIRPNSKSLTLSEVEEGVDYAILLSTNAGSWRYLIGDMIRFVNKEKCEIIITGRTKQFLSLVGEHLSQDNMNQAVENISNELKVQINEFTVAGFREEKYFAHHWYLGCDEPIDKEVAIKKIDEHLKVLNDDYRVEREEALSNLYIDILPTHVFYDFMEKTGKIGGATKFPRVLKGKRYDDWKDYISSMNLEK